MVEHNPKLEKEAGQSKVNVAANSAHAKKVSAIKQKLTGAIAADAVLTDALAQVNLAHNALGTVGDQAQGLAPVDAAQDARDAQRSANHAADDAHLVSDCQLPDFDAEFRMLNTAGVGFAHDDQVNLKKSLKQLAQKEGLKELRFWGQLQGIEADYLIAEGRFNGQGVKDANNMDHQARGTGANTNTYFYSMSFLREWVQLPDLSGVAFAPCLDHTKMLTGDPDTSVYINKDKIQESDLVRAVVARISGETHLAPAGAFAENEEGGVSAAPDFVTNPADLESVEAWQLSKALVLPNGATVYPDLGEEPSEEAVAKQEAAKEAHPEQPALRAPEEGTFTARVLGDKSTYQFGDVTKTYSAVAIKSVQWPGATAVAGEAGFVNVYVGNGIKKGTAFFTPAGMPPALQGTPVDQQCQGDPVQAENESDGEQEDAEQE